MTTGVQPAATRPSWLHSLDTNGPDARDGLSLRSQAVIFVLVLAALFTRRPDMFLHPQFYAEDGKYWYAQAYNLGWAHALWIPLGGYLNLLSRLVAAFTLLFPFRDVPLLMNCAGIVIQTLPVVALLSSRCRTWGPLTLRVAMAAIYVVMPNAWEVHVVLVNAHWHLAILELLLAFGVAPRTWFGRTMDVLLFTIGSLSDPFCILLLPLILIFWWRKRGQWTLAIAAIVGVGAVIQTFFILHGTREDFGPLAASPSLLVRFLSGDIVIDGVTGLHSVVDRLPIPLLLVVLLFAAVIVGSVLLRGRLPLRLLLAFCAATFALALHRPLLDGPHGRWPALLDDFGCRYWYYPILAFLWSAAACAFDSACTSRILRLAASCVLLLMPLGIVRDWRYRAPRDHQFSQYVATFEKMHPGEHLIIPINPEPLSMELVKH